MSHKILWTLGLILIICTVQRSLGAPQGQNSIESTIKSPPHAKILRQINKVNDDGSYTYGYEADDGSFKVETRSKDGVVKGKYGFVDANGELKTIEYTAGLKATTEDPNEYDERITAATATDAKSVKPSKSAQQQKLSESAEENDSTGSGSNEDGSNSGSNEADADFDSFGPKKESNGPSELSKRQGEPAETGDKSGQQQQYGNGGFGQGQGQGPTTHLAGGQFRGPPQQQYDPRFQQGQGFIPQNPSGFLYPQSQQHPAQVQYQNPVPAQRPVQYIQAGSPPPTVAQQPYQQRPVQGNPQGQLQGQYYPDYFSPHFSRGQTGQIPHPLQQPQHRPEVDEEGYFRGPPPPTQYFSPQYQAEGQRFPASNQYQGFGGPVQHIGGSGPAPNSFNQFPANGIRDGSNSKNKGSGEDYTPSIELDGFSDDVDQDGFVDPFPGSGDGKGGQTGGKAPPSKAPEGQRIQGPQIQVQPGLYQSRLIYQPAAGPVLSPYNEQELQHIYPNQHQSPIVSRPVSQFGVGPRPQSYPNGPGQYYSPQQQQQFAPQGVPQYYEGHPGSFESPAYFPQEHYPEGPGYYSGPGQQQFIQGNGNRFSPFGGFSPSPYAPTGPGGYPVQQYPQGGPQGVIPGQAVQLTPTPGAVTVGGTQASKKAK